MVRTLFLTNYLRPSCKRNSKFHPNSECQHPLVGCVVLLYYPLLATDDFVHEVVVFIAVQVKVIIGMDGKNER